MKCYFTFSFLYHGHGVYKKYTYIKLDQNLIFKEILRFFICLSIKFEFGQAKAYFKIMVSFLDKVYLSIKTG